MPISSYVVTKFSFGGGGGGPRTKMKKSSGNFWRAKKGFPNFSPAAAFFRCGATENR